MGYLEYGERGYRSSDPKNPPRKLISPDFEPAKYERASSGGTILWLPWE